jgi:hypothetical protein
MPPMNSIQPNTCHDISILPRSPDKCWSYPHRRRVDGDKNYRHEDIDQSLVDIPRRPRTIGIMKPIVREISGGDNERAESNAVQVPASGMVSLQAFCDRKYVLTST